MMNKNFIYHVVLTLLVAALGLVGCKDDEMGYVRISKTTVTLFPNDSYQFQVFSDEEEVFSGEIVWAIKEETPDEGIQGSVITIDELGVVTGVNKGEAVVKATLQDGRYLLAAVTVTERIGPTDPEFSFEQSKYYINPSSIVDSLVLTIDPSLLELYPLEFTSSDETVLLIDDASLLKETTQEGTYKIGIHPQNKQQEEPIKITAKLGSVEIECEVYVKVKLYLSLLPFEGASIVEIDQNSYKFSINNEDKGRDTIVVYYKAEPDDPATLNSIDFNVKTSGEGLVINHKGKNEKVSGEYLIVVTSGGVPGNAVVTVEAEGRLVTANCEVYDRNDFYVESVTMLNSEYTIEDVPFYDLLSEVDVAPFGITDYWPVEWTSSDENIATVGSDGVVLFHSPGEVDITATSRDKSAACHFKVLLKVSSIAIANTTDTYYTGESFQVAATIRANLSNVPAERLVWESSNPDVATVDAQGNVTTIAAGKSTISVSLTDDKGNTVKASKEFTVQDVATIDIYDLTVDNRFIYYQSTSKDLSIYIEEELEQEKYDNYVTFNFSEELVLEAGQTYTIGTDLSGTVTYMKSEQVVNLLSGTLQVVNGQLIFDIRVGIGATQATIRGTMNL